jgi:hypothetical protein
MYTAGDDIGASSEGDIIPAQIKEVVADQALLLTTPLGMGRVDVTDVSDHYTDDCLEGMKKNSFIK